MHSLSSVIILKTFSGFHVNGLHILIILLVMVFLPGSIEGAQDPEYGKKQGLSWCYSHLLSVASAASLGQKAGRFVLGSLQSGKTALFLPLLSSRDILSMSVYSLWVIVILKGC